MILILISLIHSNFALLCTELDIGTDIDNIGNVVSSGTVQPGWLYSDASYESSALDDEIYFYVKGLDLLGPTYEVTEFHHGDEKETDLHKWLFMNVSIDFKVDKIFKEIRAFKVDQICVDREGGTTINMNVTFKAITCDPITFNWHKVCGSPSAVRKGLNAGFKKGSSEIVLNGVVTKFFDSNLKKDVFTIPAEEEFSTIYFYHTDLFIRTAHAGAYVITDHEILKPALEGPLTTGGWIENEPLALTLTYNCVLDEERTEAISIMLELPYFHSLTIHFNKVCGGSILSSIWAALRFFCILTLVILLICGAVMLFNRMKSSGEGFSLDQLQRNIINFYREIKRAIWKTRDSDRNNFEAPEDDDGKSGLNVHTIYGTT